MILRANADDDEYLYYRVGSSNGQSSAPTLRCCAAVNISKQIDIDHSYTTMNRRTDILTIMVIIFFVNNIYTNFYSHFKGIHCF